MRLVLRGLGRLEFDNTAAQVVTKSGPYSNAEVLACGICRTDAKMWEQGHRDLILPRVLGHEMVVRDGRGQRYIVWPGESCGSCAHCRDGRENLCDDIKITGFHSDGGFARTVCVAKTSMIPIPEQLDTHIACFAEPVSCAINAFEKVQAKSKNRVLIYGGGTMGLVTALYADYLGLDPLVIEKSQTKIDHITPFLNGTGIVCVKETLESEFEIVINACGDYRAFCQGIMKVGPGGTLSFFSGLTKNEHLETNLINLLHYKEIHLSGVYGMTRKHMQRSLTFLASHGAKLQLLIEKVIGMDRVPDVMAEVLSGRSRKYIIDHSFRDKEHAILEKSETNENASPANRDVVSLFCTGILESIRPASDVLFAAAQEKIDNKTKPLGSLGKLESLAVQISCLQNSLTPTTANKQLFVFASDHGITEEGISAYPAEVTAQMVETFLKGGAAINVLCRNLAIELHIVDIGVNAPLSPHEDLIDAKVASGTKNFAIEHAMSIEQMHRALENGMRVFLTQDDLRGIDLVGFGEMGIGNTTSATAIISAITGIEPTEATGRGTGVDNKVLEHKIAVICRALDFHTLDPLNGYDILRKIGGFEIAGIAGAILAAASRGRAIFLDGLISTAAGLIAYTINPAIKGYLIAGHKSVEPSQDAALEYMGLTPLIDFEMRLGEGTGAALAIAMADSACKIMCDMASFDEANITRSSS